ncbi:uracil-DNA glycosylase [Patescibacteria group bacterium]|nr:uracil-DNA glycosylase [Patescibacteria group bacterium]
MVSDLETIHRKVKTCALCPLSQTRTHAVPGAGNPNSEIVFVGEGPGKNEDLQGLPFVGAAGKYLEQLLESINLTRDDVFITNIVKCRPPNNRDPLPDEVSTCAPYLTRQLEIMQPKLIVTLGRHAMNFFLSNLRISTAHGQPKRYRGQVYLPLYHPAAGLYRAATRADIDADFLKIPLILNKIKVEQDKTPEPENKDEQLKLI